MLATGNILQAKTLMNILLLIPLNTVNTDKYSILLLRTTTSKAALNAACWNNIYYSFCPIPTFLVPTIFLLIYHTTTIYILLTYVGNTAGLHWIKILYFRKQKINTYISVTDEDQIWYCIFIIITTTIIY